MYQYCHNFKISIELQCLLVKAVCLSSSNVSEFPAEQKGLVHRFSAITTIDLKNLMAVKKIKMLPTRKNNLISSIPKNSGKSNAKYYFSLRYVLLPFSSLSLSVSLYLYSGSHLWSSLHLFLSSVSTTFTSVTTLSSFCSATDSCHFPDSLHLLPLTLKHQLLSTASEVSQIPSEDHRACTSLLILQVQPLPPNITAWPQGQCVPPSRASQWSHTPVFASLHLFENVTVPQSPSKAIRPP